MSFSTNIVTQVIQLWKWEKHSGTSNSDITHKTLQCLDISHNTSQFLNDISHKTLWYLDIQIAVDQVSTQQFLQCSVQLLDASR